MMSAARQSPNRNQNRKSHLRCAVYTRKSTEHGLEQEFNSLDAQREACEAYIRSQAAEGWKLLSNHYDDPAYSGGNLDRPALKQLLADIQADHVDVIVVYKIDRLTRSLSDFAKLIDIFDKHKVSFVAITQQFNTTTSMGRLTLNVLLSFAQFERELSSERVRDKVAASRRKGKWTGGGVPLGYDVKNKKLVVNEVEARVVRTIFNLYLKHQSIGKLIQSLDAARVLTKLRKEKGRRIGGIRFTHGPLAHLLKNRIYVGEIGHKDSWFAGEHAALLDRNIFDQAQSLLQDHSVKRRLRRTQSGMLLCGVLFDDRGNRMSPSFSTKNGVRYRFYVSSAVLRSRKHEAGSISRVSAGEVEAAVIGVVRKELTEAASATPCDDAAIVTYLRRVELHKSEIKIIAKLPIAGLIDTTDSSVASEFRVPFIRRFGKPLCKIEEIDLPNRRLDPNLMQAIVRSHYWVRSLESGIFRSIEHLATSVGLHPKVVRKSIQIAYLAPDITAAILAGEQSPTLTIATLNRSLPLSWSLQRNILGFDRDMSQNAHPSNNNL